MAVNFNLSDIVIPLLDWYASHARVLPWRENTEPYHVWLSEIMLQQTRVEAVKPYYERFLAAVPDIRALAGAEEEKLLKLWEGLGYYSRVRNLKKAAVMICEKYGGQFPKRHKDILSLPGIGDYTAGAIASISFGLPEPAVDGNVLRVLARLREDGADINDPKRKKQAAEELRVIYPQDRSGDFTQSLMELGALVCLPNGIPLCAQCPLRRLCQARIHESQMRFPVKSGKKARKKEVKTVFVLCRNQRIAIEKRPSKGLLADLWQFPMADSLLSAEEAMRWICGQGYHVDAVEYMGSKKHIFTHIEWEMHGYLVELAARPKSPGLSQHSKPIPGQRFPHPLQTTQPVHSQDASSGMLTQSPELLRETPLQPPMIDERFTWVTVDELQESYSLPSAFQPFFRYLRKDR